MKALNKAILQLQEYEVIDNESWHNVVPIQDAVEILQNFELNYLKEIEDESRELSKR